MSISIDKLTNLEYNVIRNMRRVNPVKERSILKTIVLIVLTLAVVVSVQAADYNIALKSNYVGSVSGSVLHEGPVLQGYAIYPIKSAYAGIWFSTAGGKEDAGDEIDLFVGKTFKTLDVGVYYYALGPINSVDGDYIAPYIDWTPKTQGLLKPFFHIENDFSIEGLKSGCMYKFGAKLPVGKMNFKLTFGGHPKAFGGPSDPIAFVAIEGSIPINGMELSLRLQKKTGESNGSAKDHATISISKSFTL